MSILNIENSVLLIIDIQEKLINAVFNKEQVFAKSEILAKTSSILDIPVIITEQYPKGLGNTIDSIKTSVNKNCTYYEKTNFNALTDDNLLEKLNNLGKKQVLVMGIETHICVYQTVSALIENGFDVTIIKDACGSRSEIEHDAGCHLMEKMNADIKTTEIVLFELLKSAKHPNFKDIQNLIK